MEPCDMEVAMTRTTHRLAAAGFGVIATLAFAQPANDSCSAPTALNGFASIPWDLSLALTDGPAEPCLAGGDGQFHHDVWFLWTANTNGPTILTTCGGTDLDTRLAIYPAGSCENATPILCNDDTCFRQSGIGFNAQQGTSYLVRLGSAAADVTGTGQLIVANGVVAGPIASPDSTSHYYLVYASSWDQGESMAVTLGGHLATISSAEEDLFIRDSVLGFDGQQRRGWIGLRSPQQDGNYSWVSGDASTYRNWIPGEPNNLDGAEYWVEMVNEESFGGRWNDAPLTHFPTRFAIIEVPSTPACPADLDDNGNVEDGGTPDGAITIDDLLYFLVAFENGSVAADLDNDGEPTVGTPDGAVTIDDLLFFLVRFEGGC
jgi:hypothetical protein